MLDLEKQRQTVLRWRAANRDKIRKYNAKSYKKRGKADQAARSRKWRAENPDKKRAEFKRYKQKHPEWFTRYMRAWRRKKLVSPPPYEPPSNCEACSRPLLKPNLDHCHKTNRFRGWLCNPCNAALGLAGDNAASIKKLLDYIVRAEAMIDAQLID